VSDDSVSNLVQHRYLIGV